MKRTGNRSSSSDFEESAVDCEREVGESQAKKMCDAGVPLVLPLGVSSTPDLGGCPGPENMENLPVPKKTQLSVTEDAPEKVNSPGPVPPPDPVRRYPSQERRSPQRLICEL